MSLFSAAYHSTKEVSFVYHDVAGFTQRRGPNFGVGSHVFVFLYTFHIPKFIFGKSKNAKKSDWKQLGNFFY